MKPKLKPLREQVVVITGATSGIGLTTARMAASEGAKVFLIARNESELRVLQEEIQKNGGEADYFVCDVADENGIRKAADACVKRFGGFDTWVNNAGVSVYGKVMETPTEEAKRLFETNYWGVFHGSRAAIPALRSRGGVLINIGSVLSEVGLPVQGVYSSSKFAVKGLTDALRRELKSEKAPVSVTLVKPGAINTPYTRHAGNHLPGQPLHVPPVYAPEAVARVILACAQKPVREIGVGAPAFLYPFIDQWIPRVQDFVMSRFLMEGSQSKRTAHPSKQETALFSPPEQEGNESGDYPGHVIKSSITTEIVLRPWISRAIAVGLSALGYSVWRRRLESSH